MTMNMRIAASSSWFPVAVQALVLLAQTGRACTSTTMAQGVHAHAVSVRRVLALLVRAQLIKAREGRDGGYVLARPAEQITLAEVYQAIRPVDTGRPDPG